MRRSALMRIAHGLVFTAVMLCMMSRTGYADNAVVLPKGFFFFNLEGRHYLPTDQRFDRDGNAVNIGTDYSRNLTSQVFSGLAPLNPLVGGTASIGSSEVQITRDYNMFRPLLAYGLTDRITLGVIIPYIWATNRVTANVNSSTANVGKNSFCFKNPACGPLLAGAPIAPLNTPGSRALNTNDVQNLLGGGLDIDGDGIIDVPGQGFKRVETRSTEGIGDIEFGGRYQYYRSEYWRLAFTSIAIAPTGQRDNPDDLVDIPLGDGNWGVRFQFLQDFSVQRDGLSKRLGFPGPGDFFINTKFEYLYNAPDKRVARVCSPRQPVCSDKDEVTRKVGDIIEAGFQGNVGVLVNGLILVGGYTYTHQLKAAYSGSHGLDYGSLATDSESVAHDVQIGFTYTTVPLVVQKQFPFPLSANLLYQDRLAGENVYKSRYVSFTLSAYF